MSNFDRLDARIQRWIWQKKWKELRQIQDRAIEAILDTENDVVIVAGTAEGKTEAAFLPILTDIVDRVVVGFSVLYISPLKALINDQFGRLEQLCEELEIDVVRWHGDAPQAGKERALRNPKGVVQITPESIEALFVRRPVVARRLFQSIHYIVIDELHYFLDEGPRGLHLSVLLNRLDDVSEKRARRIGLSATVGDIEVARRYLNWHDPENPLVLQSFSDNAELLTQVKGYVEEEEVQDGDALQDDDVSRMALDRIADDIFRVSKGENNLIFAGSRRRVESITDRLRMRCEKQGTPNEFFAHHGSLSKEVRHELEARLREGNLPTTAVATTTLELGIDLGSIKATGRVGAPSSMASLRQQVGRSGRREGRPAILRIYVRERRVHSGSPVAFRLRLEIVRSVAAIRLLIERFIEAPSKSLVMATVVLQQTMSLIAEHGGVKADKLFALIAGSGPLSAFPKADFIRLLRGMAGETKLIEQAPNGLLMLGEVGERLIAKRDFYAMFETQDEWRVVNGSETLGTVPLSHTIGVGGLIAFAGKRWRIEAMDDISKVLIVVPHRYAKIPQFESLGSEVISTRMAEEMRLVLGSDDEYPYLDKMATTLLKEARQVYRDLQLDAEVCTPQSDGVFVFTWVGSKVNELFAQALTMTGLSVAQFPASICLLGADQAVFADTMATLAKTGVTVEEIAASIESLRAGKWDEYVPVEVLRNQWCRSHAPYMTELNYLIVDLASKLGYDPFASDPAPENREEC
jgi:ATP-dependent Lhr-like helicase